MTEQPNLYVWLARVRVWLTTKSHSRRWAAIGALMWLEAALLLVSVTPQSVWASLRLPNGPIPPLLTPLVAALFYLLPPLIGVLCLRWYQAIVLAALPMWLALGLFAVAAASRLGFAYLAQDAHASASIGSLELFAGLGLLGWLARLVARDAANWWKAPR